jgi:hypothetical protein
MTRLDRFLLSALLATAGATVPLTVAQDTTTRRILRKVGRVSWLSTTRMK